MVPVKASSEVAEVVWTAMRPPPPYKLFSDEVEPLALRQPVPEKVAHFMKILPPEPV